MDISKAYDELVASLEQPDDIHAQFAQLVASLEDKPPAPKKPIIETRRPMAVAKPIPLSSQDETEEEIPETQPSVGISSDDYGLSYVADDIIPSDEIRGFGHGYDSERTQLQRAENDGLWFGNLGEL